MRAAGCTLLCCSLFVLWVHAQPQTPPGPAPRPTVLVTFPPQSYVVDRVITLKAILTFNGAPVPRSDLVQRADGTTLTFVVMGWDMQYIGLVFPEQFPQSSAPVGTFLINQTFSGSGFYSVIVEGVHRPTQHAFSYAFGLDVRQNSSAGDNGFSQHPFKFISNKISNHNLPVALSSMQTTPIDLFANKYLAGQVSDTDGTVNSTGEPYYQTNAEYRLFPSTGAPSFLINPLAVVNDNAGAGADSQSDDGQDSNLQGRSVSSKRHGELGHDAIVQNVPFESLSLSSIRQGDCLNIRVTVTRIINGTQDAPKSFQPLFSRYGWAVLISHDSGVASIHTTSLAIGDNAQYEQTCASAILNDGVDKANSVVGPTLPAGATNFGPEFQTSLKFPTPGRYTVVFLLNLDGSKVLASDFDLFLFEARPTSGAVRQHMIRPLMLLLVALMLLLCS